MTFSEDSLEVERNPNLLSLLLTETSASYDYIKGDSPEIDRNPNLLTS